MTPKEKAKELLWKYLPILESWERVNSHKAKECALIAVDEILDALDQSLIDADREWWKQVKQEIEKL